MRRLKEKLSKLKEEMGKLAAYETQMLASPDSQISDPLACDTVAVSVRRMGLSVNFGLLPAGICARYQHFCPVPPCPKLNYVVSLFREGTFGEQPLPNSNRPQ
jgi:hypothetical protein